MATAEMPKSRPQNTSHKPTADVTLRPTSVTLCTLDTWENVGIPVFAVCFSVIIPTISLILSSTESRWLPLSGGHDAERSL